MIIAKYSEDIASEPHRARGDDANGVGDLEKIFKANLCPKNWGQYKNGMRSPWENEEDHSPIRMMQCSVYVSYELSTAFR